MNRFFSFSKVLLAGLAFVTMIACDNSEDDVTPNIPEELSIADIAAGDDQFTTLVSALQRVNLVSVLDGPGSFTVFAPTNDAFDALGVDLGTITDEALTEILLYHVIGAEVASTSIAEGQTYVDSEAATGPNTNKLSLFIEKNSAGVKINNIANVTTADVSASNGVIHIIDQVIMPLDVVGHAQANENFTSLVGALAAAEGDLVNVLSADGPFTVFAPVNTAFDAIADVTSTLDMGQLSKVLTYHVVTGNVMSTDLSNAMNVSTVNGENITINLEGGAATIVDAQGGTSNIVLTDVQAKNGVIHVLDRVILPQNL